MCERHCSVLTLESGAGFTLADSFFNGLIDARPEETSHASNCELMQDSLPFGRRNDKRFTSQDQTVLDGESLFVLPIQAEGMRDLLDVLWPASNDEVSKSSHIWITDEGLLESFIVVWHYVGMMDSDIQWKIGAWPGTESRECVWYGHFLAWAVTDCEVISL